MNKDHFLSTKQLKLNLISSQKKLTQWHHRYVIQVITDQKMEIVKKTFRDFQYFNKIIHDKFNIANQVLNLQRARRSNDKYRNLQCFIGQLNSGILIYDHQLPTSLLSHQTRQLRGYLYSLLFEEDALFVEGVDESDDSDKETKGTLASKNIEVKEKAGSWKVENSYSPDKKNGSVYDKLTKRKQESKGENITNLTKGILNFVMKGSEKRKKSIQISDASSLKAILKTIDNCWIKVKNQFKNRDRGSIFHDYRWEKYGIELSDKMITLTKDNHRRIVILYNADIHIHLKQQSKIVISYPIDKDPLQIRLDDNGQQNEDIYAKYLALYTQLKSIVQNHENDEESSSAHGMSRIHNKIRLRLGIKKNQITTNLPIQPVEQAIKNVASHLVHKEINIKFIHQQINLSISMPFQTSIQVDMPIINNFGAIEIFFSEISKTAGFLPNIKDPQVSSFHIPIQTIYNSVYNKNKIKKKNIDPKYQSTSNSTINIKQKFVELKNTKVSVNLDFKSLANSKSYYSCEPQDIYESDLPPVQFTKDDLRMSMNRLKRIIWTIQEYSMWVKDLKNFTYPNLSYLFYFTTLMILLLFDGDYMLQWILASLVIVLLNTNPNCRIYCSQFVDIMGYREKWEVIKLQLYKKNVLLPSDFTKQQRKQLGGMLVSLGIKGEKYEQQTVHHKPECFQHQYVKSTRKLQKQLFLKDFQLTKKVKRSIYKKYRRFQQLLILSQYALFFLVNFIQKIKNVFMWYHYEKTKFLLCLFAGAFLMLSIIPFRVVCLFALFKAFRKGKSYHKITQDLLRALIEENNMTYIKTYFKDHSRALDISNPQTQYFFKKCRQSLGDWLQVTYDSILLQQKSPNMAAFVSNLSKCKTKFKIKPQICQKYKFNIEWSRSQSSATKLSKIISGFILNVPSDKFIMGVKTISGDESEQEDNEEFLDLQL